MDTVVFRDSRIFSLYKALYTLYGAQHWWPGDSPFEIMVGAILAQNTNWRNVEQAILNIKAARLMDVHALYKHRRRIAQLIKPSGFYRLKSKRLIAFLEMLLHKYAGRIEIMKSKKTMTLRRELTAISGIGNETADSMLLYALQKPVFVIDAYTRRIGSRHKLFDIDALYDEIRMLFEDSIPKQVTIYNEYHAMLVKVGKEHCRKHEPLCDTCPVQHIFTS